MVNVSFSYEFCEPLLDFFNLLNNGQFEWTGLYKTTDQF